MNYNQLSSLLIEKTKKFETITFGKSNLGETMFCFHVGRKNGKQVLLEGGIHAREYISTLFLLKELDFLKTQNLNGGFYIIPMMNPDGVRLVLDGVNHIKEEKIKDFLIKVNKSNDFSLFKANVNCVDLNVNFDADWGNGKQNVKEPKSENFIGYKPHCEIEIINFLNLIKTLKIDASLSFHSKGEVIYYGFNMFNERLEKERAMALKLCEVNGYEPIKLEGSCGGLSDYMSEKVKIPAFTIELGNNNLKHPIDESHLEYIFKQNKSVPLKMLELLNN